MPRAGLPTVLEKRLEIAVRLHPAVCLHVHPDPVQADEFRQHGHHLRRCSILNVVLVLNALHLLEDC